MRSSTVLLAWKESQLLLLLLGPGLDLVGLRWRCRPVEFPPLWGSSVPTLVWIDDDTGGLLAMQLGFGLRVGEFTVGVLCKYNIGEMCSYRWFCWLHGGERSFVGVILP